VTGADDRKMPEWQKRLQGRAQDAFDRSRERQEREAAIAEQRRDLRHAIKSIDERLKVIGTSSHDPQLREEREALQKHRGELWQTLERLDAGRSGPEPRGHDRSFDRN